MTSFEQSKTLEPTFKIFTPVDCKEKRTLEEVIKKNFSEIENILNTYRNQILHSMTLDNNISNTIKQIKVALDKTKKDMPKYRILQYAQILQNVQQFIQEIDRKIIKSNQEWNKVVNIVALEDYITEEYVSCVFRNDNNDEYQVAYFELKNDKEIEQLDSENNEDIKTYKAIRDMIQLFIEKKQKEWIIVKFGELLYPLYFKVICRIWLEENE